MNVSDIRSDCVGGCTCTPIVFWTKMRHLSLVSGSAGERGGSVAPAVPSHTTLKRSERAWLGAPDRC